jgi:hypothetical protein
MVRLAARPGSREIPFLSVSIRLKSAKNTCISILTSEAVSFFSLQKSIEFVLDPKFISFQVYFIYNASF